jgi:anaerobic magnesium-protoporphyrin IX monomethyl ester cyclase
MAWPPLELMIIAGCLKGMRDVTTHIFDAVTLKADWSDIKEVIKKRRPALVVFTTSTPTIYHDLQVARIAKHVCGESLTMAIGTHVTALPEETLRLCPELDSVCIGESELTIKEYIHSGFNASAVLGIAYRRNGNIISNRVRPVCQNLDELGFPAHDKVPLELYHDPFSRSRPMSVTFASRGCVNQPPCIMCSACFFSNERYRSVGHLMDEMRWLKELGVHEIRFPFESGFHDVALAEELFKRMISQQLGLRFTCNARADYLTEPLLKLMREAGCMAVNIGCESVDEDVAQLSQKKITPQMVSEAVHNAKKCGLGVLVYFIFGLPHETKQSMRRTLDYAKKLGADMVTFGVAIPHPQTAFYRYLKSHGYLKTEDWSRYDPMLPAPYDYPELSGEQIFAFANHAYRSFYLSPRFAVSRIRSLTSFAHIRDNLRLFKGFMQRYVFRNG